MSCLNCGAVAIPEQNICPDCLINLHPNEVHDPFPEIDISIVEDLNPTTDISQNEIESVFQEMLIQSCKS